MVVVVVGHAADHTVSVGFCGSNRRCAMVVQWTVTCMCSGGLGCYLAGFCGFPIYWWLILSHGFVGFIWVCV